MQEIKMGDGKSPKIFSFRSRYVAVLLLFFMGTFCTLYIKSFSNFTLQNFVCSSSYFAVSLPAPSSPYSAPFPSPLPEERAFAPSVSTNVTSSNGTSSSNITSITENVTLKDQTTPLMHNMSDTELFSLASSVSEIRDFTNKKQAQKVAFMFLTPGRLPLSPLWEVFFKGHEGLYSIYVHPHPSFNETYPRDSVFYHRAIPSQPLYWGTISMVDAERRLLGNALLDLSNQRFVLLSDSCIPLFNFTTIYNYLMGSNQSFLGSFDDPRKPGRGRYNKKMWPTITLKDWRKGAQWFELHRDLANKIISDTKYYAIFKEFCLPPCYNDEHYMPTLVNIRYSKMNSNRTVTFVDWSKRGPHPGKFKGSQITDEFLSHIRFGSECVYGDNVTTTTICHLFARKFQADALGPLLRMAPLLYGKQSLVPASV